MDILSGVNGGPLVLFDPNEQSMVLAPFREFMAGSMYHNQDNNAVEWGVMGSMQSIPKDFNFETAIVAGNGIKTVSSWFHVPFFYLIYHCLKKTESLKQNYT